MRLSLQRPLDSIIDFILRNIKSYTVVWTVLGPLYIPRNFPVQNVTQLLTLSFDNKACNYELNIV